MKTQEEIKWDSQREILRTLERITEKNPNLLKRTRKAFYDGIAISRQRGFDFTIPNKGK